MLSILEGLDAKIEKLLSNPKNDVVEIPNLSEGRAGAIEEYFTSETRKGIYDIRRIAVLSDKSYILHISRRER